MLTPFIGIGIGRIGMATQAGTALIIGLIVLTALTLLGLFGMRTARRSRNGRQLP